MAVKTSWAAGDVLTAADLTDTFGAKWTTQNAWTAYTPTWTNLTVGNATQTFRYLQIGKAVLVEGRIVFGSTTSITGTAPTFTLPVTSYRSDVRILGTMVLGDAGNATYVGYPISSSNTTAILFAQKISGSYLIDAAVTSTVPFTWGTGDFVQMVLTYEAA